MSDFTPITTGASPDHPIATMQDASPEGPVLPASSSPTLSQPMVSSEASRTTYNNNSQILDGKLAALNGGQYTDPATGQKYNGVGPDGKPLLDPNQNTGAPKQIGPETQPQYGKATFDANGKPTSDVFGNPLDANGNGIPQPKTVPGRDSTVNPDGSPKTTGIDDKYAQMATSYTANAQSQVDSAKTEFEQWRKTNDEVSNALIDSITQTFEASIAQMTEMNRQATARDTKTGYAGGGARYSPQINDSVISDTVQKGMMRISNLKAQELSAIAQAKQARNDKDIAKFNEYMKVVDQSNKDVQSELLKIAAQANADKNTLVKQSQDQRNAEKAQQALDISNSNELGKGLVSDYAAITDPTLKKKYILEKAQKYNIDPAFIEAGLNTALQTQSKTENTTANTQSQIDARTAKTANDTKNTAIKQQNADRLGKPKTPTTKGGKDGTFTYTPTQVDAVARILNEGYKQDGKTVYNPRGKDDGFVDPDNYLAALAAWTNSHNGGTPAGFAKLFPVKTNINPESYTKLPAAIRPTVKAGKAGTATFD